MRRNKLIAILLGTLINLSAYSQNPTVQNIINDIRIDSMKQTIRQLSGDMPVMVGSNTYTLNTRHDSLPENEIAFQLLKQKIIGYGLSPDSTIFTYISPQIIGTTGKNLIIKQPGTIYPGKQFIICGHYDSQCPPPHLNCHGADDNASSCAAILEAARIMKNYSFPYTILYIFFDSEEPPPFKNGSKDYISNSINPNDTILGVINLDQISYDSNSDDSAAIHTSTIANSLSLSNKMITVNSLYSIGLKLQDVVNPTSGTSDHRSFWDSNYTAIMLVQYYINPSINDFNPNWHSPNDLYSTINIPYFGKMATLAIATLADCALDTSNIFSGVNDFSMQHGNRYAFPNPFQNIIEIHYDVFSPAHIEVSVYNIQGEVISQLVNENQSRGEYNITWDGKNIAGASLPNGLYFYHMQIGNESYYGKLILNK